MLQGDDVDARVEGSGPNGKSSQIAHDIEARVVPSRITDGQVEREVALAFKIAGVRAFSRASVKHACSRRKIAGEVCKVAFDGGFKVKHEAAQKGGKKALEARVIQAAVYFRLASSMIVDPAPQAASKIVNGRAPTTSEK